MNVLYFFEPNSVVGGVANVAYYLPKALSKNVNVTYFPQFTPEKGYLKKFFNVYKKFVMKKFDIIHFIYTPIWINGSYILLKFAKRRGAHTVLNIHGIIPLEHKLARERARSLGTISSINLSNALSSCKVADRIVVNSKHMRTSVVTWYGVNRNKIVVIPNGVDLKMFSECDDRVVLEGDPTILYLGGFYRIKGVDVLIHAIAKLRSELPNMKLHLVGAGNMMSDFQLLAKKKGIEKFVIFHGWAPHSIVSRYYKSADICVFPSRHEGFPIAILEAMASGIPIIASDIEVFQEIAHPQHGNDKNCILFKSEDADALSKTILALSQDSDLRRKISQAALKKVTEYSWENIAERYVSLYRCLYEGASAG